MPHGSVHSRSSERLLHAPGAFPTTVRFRPGETVCVASDVVDTVHQIVSGQLKLVRSTEEGHERIVAVLGAGDLVGATVMVPGARHGVDVVAITEVVTRPSSRDDMLRSIRASPQAAAALTSALAAQLHVAWSLLEEVYLPVRSRLARALLELAHRFAAPSRNGVCTLRSRVSHDELAAMIGAQRVSVSVAMAELRDEGVVAGARGVYRIDTAGLETIAFGRDAGAASAVRRASTAS